MTAILRYDAACQALSEARTFDEVRDWEDKAAAVREYARRANNREMEIDAAEIRVRAQRRRGELLAEMKASGQLSEGRRKLSLADDSLPRLTLEELDTSRDESSKAQKLAAIEPGAFERLAARVRARLTENPEVHSFDVLRERDGPVNGARSVMGSRREPDDSLDYFPTPPWATRALIECVLPAAGLEMPHSTWDPACGEGHMTGVLEEYAISTIGSDIFDYSVDGRMPPSWWRQGDFLDPAQFEDGIPAVDWIVTNPPFGEKAEAFVLRALDLAHEGVAMFFRLQWLETNGRYERIFAPHPPAIIAQFAERVPLHKGQWKPDGDTATAYLWIVWHKARQEAAGLTRFMWIPPGQRAALARPDDVDRFTAHPVMPTGYRGRIVPPHDPSTGEIVESIDGDGEARDQEGASAPLFPNTPASTLVVTLPPDSDDSEQGQASTSIGALTAQGTRIAGRGGEVKSSPPQTEIDDIPNFLRVGHAENDWRGRRAAG